jgi:hypothetical protein
MREQAAQPLLAMSVVDDPLFVTLALQRGIAGRVFQILMQRTTMDKG